MTGPLGVISVLLLEAAAGGAFVLWASGVWGAVRRGFFLLTGATIALCAWGAWATADAGGAGGGALMPAALLVFAGSLTLWQLVLVIGQSRLSQVLGLVAAVAGFAALIATGVARDDRVGLAIAELLLGALFLGSTLFGLLLGHWYLVERRLPNTYMVRSAWWYAAGVVAAAVAAWLSATNPAPSTGGFSPFLSVPGFSVLLAAGLVAICALIAAFVWRLASEGGRSIQAATGMFYLAVIMAFSAELSTKFRFF